MIETTVQTGTQKQLPFFFFRKYKTKRFVIKGAGLKIYFTCSIISRKTKTFPCVLCLRTKWWARGGLQQRKSINITSIIHICSVLCIVAAVKKKRLWCSITLLTQELGYNANDVMQETKKNNHHAHQTP